jgi:hypothetical protein
LDFQLQIVRFNDTDLLTGWNELVCFGIPQLTINKDFSAGGQVLRDGADEPDQDFISRLWLTLLGADGEGRDSDEEA